MSADARFLSARAKVFTDSGTGNDIGRLSEKALHRIIKYYIEPDESCHEVKTGRYVADIRNSKGIFEIQTRNIERLKPKLKTFLRDNSVCVVLPFAARKTVSWINPETGELSAPRKSPKSETVFDAFFELNKIKELFDFPALSFKLLFLDASEYRYQNGVGKERKRFSERCERIPNSVVSEIDIRSKAELFSLLPENFPLEFKAKDLKAFTKRNARHNHYILHFLLDMGFVSFVGKDGRAYVYRKIPNEELE